MSIEAVADRGREFWAPQPIWQGERCFLLGGGPSLDQATVDRVRGHGRVIAINSSCRLAPWADALFFTDNGWFEPRAEIVANWPGLVFTLSRHAKAALPNKIRRVEAAPWAPDFPPAGSPTIRQGRSSGHTAVSVAIALGVVSVVLLGYDVCFDGRGRSHHHDEYIEADPLLYERDFLPAWAGWNAAALRVCVNVLNATPGSALREFPLVSLDDVLALAEVAA